MPGAHYKGVHHWRLVWPSSVASVESSHDSYEQNPAGFLTLLVTETGNWTFSSMGHSGAFYRTEEDLSMRLVCCSFFSTRTPVLHSN